MKINYSLKTFQKGSKVKIKSGKKVYTPEQKKILYKDYNLEHLIRSTSGQIMMNYFTVIDMDSVFQPTLSIDLPGIKIYHPQYKNWVLPRWALKHAE